MGDAARVEKALRLCYRVVLPRLARDSARAQLGYARPASAVACARSVDFYIAMGLELGEWWERIASDSAIASDSPEWRRIERTHLEDAAADLLDMVRALPKPWREVLVRRVSGMGWRQISRELPERAWFSIVDDYNRALEHVWGRADNLVRRMVG